MVADHTDIQAAARRFLRTGRPGDLALPALSAACDALVRAETQHSAPRAIRLGEQFARRAEGLDRAMLLAALRALGWAYVVGGQYEAAAETYLKARRRARDPLVRARIDRILVDVYMYLGRLGEARRRARQAMAAFRRHRAADDLAKTEVNYGNVLHRMDRHQEARELYHRAGQYFKERGNDLAAATCWYNEANTLVQLFEFGAAERLYSAAREIYDRHDHALRAIGCLYGLAWLHMLGGQFHIALTELAECEDFYERSGQSREYLLCVLDRAETYLGLNLLPDARDASRRAERRARRLGLRYESGKAAFFLGKALAALGDDRGARSALVRAADRFRRDDNESFLTAVRMTAALTGRTEENRLELLRRTRSKMPPGQLPLWEALCDLELLAMDADSRDARSRLKGNPAVRVMPHLRARYLTFLGDDSARHGQIDRAIRHWSRAADILSAVRADLPPIDLRASFSAGHTGPYERLVNARPETNPRESAGWLERYQTAGVSMVGERFRDEPARAKVQRSLSELALHVAAAAEHLGHGMTRPAEMSARPTVSQRRLEEKVRDDLAALERGGAAAGEALVSVLRDIRKAARGGPVVQYHVTTSDLVAFVHEGNETRVCRLVGKARALDLLQRRWRFFVERAPYRSEAESVADLAEERRLLTQLGDLIWTPLEISTPGRVLMAADGSLANLPWGALSPGGRPLIDGTPLVMTPSIRHHLAAADHRTDSHDVRVFVGESADLSLAPIEYAPLERDAGRVVSIHRPCVRADWPTESEADIWHYTGHAHFRADNPFYSFLSLGDGPLFAADFRLRRNVVNLVVLAACRTGLHSLLPGDESAGLIRALIEMGARNVVASHWAISDRSTSVWMRAMYEALVGGSDIADATREAARLTREKFPSAHDWAGFSLFGAG